MAHFPVRSTPVLARRTVAHNKKLGTTSCTLITMPAGEPIVKLIGSPAINSDERPQPDWHSRTLLGRASPTLQLTGGNSGLVYPARHSFIHVIRYLARVASCGGPAGSFRFLGGGVVVVSLIIG